MAFKAFVFTIIFIACHLSFTAGKNLYFEAFSLKDTKHDTANSTCSMDMYGNDLAAYWACKTQFAHQSNWFPSPIAGLFSYEIWNGYDGFWQNGAVLEPMVNFIAYTSHTHTRYKQVILGSERGLYSLLEAYGPYPSFDDMAWYGLSFARIYEIMGESLFQQDAIDILNWCWETGWDKTGKCHGGFYFDNLFNTKQIITNVEMLQLAARLYRLTGDPSLLDKVNKTFDFIMYNNFINSTNYLIIQGMDLNCTLDNVYGATYLSGVMVGALVEMHSYTRNASFLDLADKMADAVIQFSSDNITGVLVEYCEPNCNDDQKMFKGIFVRNIRHLMDALPDKSRRQYYQNWLNIQVKSNIIFNICDKVPISECNITFQDGPPYFNISGPVFSPNWRGPFSIGAPMQQTAVLDLLVAAILPGTTCKGQYCSYDPNYPPPQPLTCGSHPCPSDEDCCEYSPYTSYTCCAEGQKCNKTEGICV